MAGLEDLTQNSYSQVDPYSPYRVASIDNQRVYIPMPRSDPRSNVPMPRPSPLGGPAGAFSDIAAGAMTGMGQEMSSLAGLPRSYMEAINKGGYQAIPDWLIKKLPTEEQAAEQLAKYKRFLPLSDAALARLGLGPQTTYGEWAQKAGQFAPFLPAWQLRALRPLIGGIYGAESMAPP